MSAKTYSYTFGIRILENEMIGDPYEDWSQVRSPGRARRRRTKHPQRIVIRYRANGKFIHDKRLNVIYCHPTDANIFRTKLSGPSK